MKKTGTRNLALSAMFLAIGLILPILTDNIPQIGQMLCPMHIPVLLCGLICGWEWGAAVGFLCPLLRSVLFGVPVLYPNGLAMTFELMTYGLVIGLLYAHVKNQSLGTLYASLIAAMVSGRVVWGIVRVILSGVSGAAFTWEMYISGALLNAIPGIIIQLILIPVIMVVLDRTGSLRMRKAGS